MGQAFNVTPHSSLQRANLPGTGCSLNKEYVSLQLRFHNTRNVISEDHSKILLSGSGVKAANTDDESIASAIKILLPFGLSRAVGAQQEACPA